MKITLTIIFLLFTFQITAQNAGIQSKIDFFNSKIQQTEKGERLAWLDSLTKMVEYKSEFKYDSIARQTIDFAIGLDSLNLSAMHVANLIYYHNNIKGQPKEGLALFNTYFKAFETKINDPATCRLYLNTADSYYYTENIDKAIDFYEKAKIYALKSNEKRLLGFANLYIGYAESDTGKLAASSLSLKTAISLFIEVKDTFNIISSKNALSILYSKNAFYKEAEKERIEAIYLAKKSNYHDKLIGLYYNAAEDYKRTGNVVNQIADLKKSLQANSLLDNEFLLRPILLAALINAYAENDRLNLAKDNFKELERIYQKTKTTKNRVFFLDAKKSISFYEGDYKNALKYGLEYLELRKQKSGYEEIMMAEKFLGNVYKSKNEVSNSNKHFMNYYAMKDSISSVQNVKSLVYYQTLYETEKRDHQIENQQASIGLLNLENKNKKQLLIFGSIGLIIFFCLVIVLRSRKNLKDMQFVQEKFSQNLISAREEERTTVARDLHDSVGQKLMLLTKITRANKNDELETLSSSSLEELRTVLRGLHPPAIKDLGITKAIEALVNEVDSHTDIFFTNDIENIDNILSNDNALHLYRIIQESLNNIVKHANAKATFVTVEKVKKQILVEIKDNGNGFDFSKNTKHSAHFGMKTLKERAKIIKSKLDIVSQHNQGTVIKLIIPI